MPEGYPVPPDVSDRLPCGNAACKCRVSSEEGIFKWGRRFCSEYCIGASNTAAELCYCGDSACTRT